MIRVLERDSAERAVSDHLRARASSACSGWSSSSKARRNTSSRVWIPRAGKFTVERYRRLRGDCLIWVSYHLNTALRTTYILDDQKSSLAKELYVLNLGRFTRRPRCSRSSDPHSWAIFCEQNRQYPKSAKQVGYIRRRMNEQLLN